jgi:hypothetical protein
MQGLPDGTELRRRQSGAYRNADFGDPTVEPKSKNAKTYQYEVAWPNLVAIASTTRIPEMTPPIANQIRSTRFMAES